MIPKEHIVFLNPDTLAPPRGYSQVVQVTGGKTIYLAGQVALDASNHLVGPGDFRAQARQIFENIRLALAAVETDFSSVVKLNIYLLDLSNLPILSEVRESFVNTAAPPVSTLVEVRSLAREEFLLEVEAIASISA